MNYEQLANALIKALRESTAAGLANIAVQRRNFGEDLLNRANTRGTLYSTAPAFERARAESTKFLPAEAELRQKQNIAEIGTKTALLDTRNQIKAMNKSAAELNSITFDHLLV